MQRLLDILRPYQKEDVLKMLKTRRFYNTNDMGLGKTLETLCCIQEGQNTPTLIVCPKFALSVWQEEINKWLGMSSVIYSGTPKEREALWKQFITEGHKFLITNYAMLPELAIRSGIKIKTARTANTPPGTFSWKGMICDEVHMAGIFNYKTITYKICKKFACEVDALYLLTGTPFRQGCADLFGPLSLIDPKRFNSYWSFINRYCVITETPFGKKIERNPANLTLFRGMIREYSVRRLKTEVLHELPGKLRQPLIVDMNKEQRKIYDDLTRDLMAMVDNTGDIIVSPLAMTLMVRQRQILCCPQELGLRNRGGAIDTIIDHSHLKLDEDKPIVVFTPFRKALPYLHKAFKEEYPDVHIYEIRGQLTAQEFGDTWLGFQNDKYKKRVMLCVIKSGASFQATAADTAYFLGYEFDFNLNEQAEDRLNRMGQKNFVNIYYIMHKGTVDEQILSRLNEKKTAANWVMGSDGEYLKMLKSSYGIKRK